MYRARADAAKLPAIVHDLGTKKAASRRSSVWIVVAPNLPLPAIRIPYSLRRTNPLSTGPLPSRPIRSIFLCFRDGGAHATNASRRSYTKFGP